MYTELDLNRITRCVHNSFTTYINRITRGVINAFATGVVPNTRIRLGLAYAPIVEKILPSICRYLSTDSLQNSLVTLDFASKIGRLIDVVS